ncbi:MAG: CDP-diacylglycerol--glycerol-3-phosphate 3-phosphatidyltransferase [Ignavibacteriales bacterium]|nr:CDP-diacylglycerol--glycerol-3-phosphate 3-phosphatidyltransferase [Ignavibacteriales bacterium]
MILPNQLTTLRIILTPFFLFFFLQPDQMYKEISLVIFLIAALTDWYDGWLARKFNYFTSWGKFMDPLADKILTAAAFGGLVFLGVLQLWMVVIILVRDFTITLFRGYTDYKGLSFPTSRYAKWKTFIQMVFLYSLLVIYILSGETFLKANFSQVFYYLLHPGAIWWITLVITIITVDSGIRYFIENREIIKRLIQK